METHVLFSVPLQTFSREAYGAYLRTLAEATSVHTVHTVNPEMLVDARLHAEFSAVLSSATVCVPDGAGIRYACLALFDDLIEVHPGVDTIIDLADIAHEERLRIAVCGARPQEHEVFTALLAKRAPAAPVLCIDPGIIDERDPHLSLPVVERLVAFAPHIVLVALGQGRGVRQGKQERIVQELVLKLPSARIIMGVGGALDMLGGSVERAPSWMRKRNLEWMYRFVLQPWRCKRIFKALVVFPSFIVWETIKKHVFFQATVRVFRQVIKDVK
jgi:N-acetylglucosaminyldiphosphoundecaprenol N-acetyl-beta-D-mannosaminyltransferase